MRENDANTMRTAARRPDKEGMENPEAADTRTAAVRLGDSGEAEFFMDQELWIVSMGGIPEAEYQTRLFPERQAGPKLRRICGKESVNFEYGESGERTKIKRTIEYTGKTGSFTILDEIGADGGQTRITEKLYFGYPVQISKGAARITACGRIVTVLVRNQENLRTEKLCGGMGQDVYCLKWEVKREQGYTCCQVEFS